MSWASLARYQRLIVTIITQLINIMVDQVPADEKEALTSDLMGKHQAEQALNRIEINFA